jgi:hypothetical protein
MSPINQFDQFTSDQTTQSDQFDDDTRVVFGSTLQFVRESVMLWLFDISLVTRQL